MTEEEKKVVIAEILDEVYDIFMDKEKASYQHGWNDGLKRAVIIIQAEFKRGDLK